MKREAENKMRRLFCGGAWAVALMLCGTLSMLTFTACSDDDDEATTEEENPYGIPSDDLADSNPSLASTTTSLPSVSYTIEEWNDDAIVSIYMTGIYSMADYSWMRLSGTAESDQNVWLELEETPKGISVHNTADDEDEDQVWAADLAFLVDNSGSMSQEADSVASSIIEWAENLESSSLDIRFACVGYNDNGRINGALNFTTADTLSTYLNRYTGTDRTVGFSGEDAATLSAGASAYKVSNECGGMALRFADSLLSFRDGANRVYVNLTDEPNQPAYKTAYSTEYFSDTDNWSATQGTVHTVYSSDTTFTEIIGYAEKPWRLSWYTGGTVMTAPSNFAGVTLDSLPVTGALQNSYIIRFTNVKEFRDGQDHLVKITVLSDDNLTRAEKTFYVNLGTAEGGSDDSTEEDE